MLYLDTPNDELGIEHEDGLVLPGILGVKVDPMQDVLNEGVGHDGEEDGVLEAEDELHRGTLAQGGVVGHVDEVGVECGEEEGEGEDADVEEERNGGRPLHEVDPVLSEPVERLEEQ